MIDLDGLNIERGGSELEPIYIITESSVTVASVQSFVESARDLVDPEELWNALTGLEEDAILKVRGKSQALSALDVFEEIEEAFEYARIDISEF